VTDTTFGNAYEDARFAHAYSLLDFPGTYYLAFRDVPVMIAEHVRGKVALDFGCGAGRSTRLLRRLGFDAIGIDISAEMVGRAREIDPSGDYRVIEDGDFRELEGARFDLVLSAFTFDNIPSIARKVGLFRGLSRLLAPRGRMVNLVSSPDIYTHEWASFSTAAYPANTRARSGDIVLIVNTAISDSRPVADVLCTDETYREVFDASGLSVLEARRPLATGEEPCEWINETRIAPWVIYMLGRAESGR
jgi:SAM-dependent methyltransferase